MTGEGRKPAKTDQDWAKLLSTLSAYADGCEAKAGITLWIAFYNSRRPHQALGNRTPMAVWCQGTSGPLGAAAVDMMDNVRASPTCPQPQQQQQAFAMVG